MRWALGMTERRLFREQTQAVRAHAHARTQTCVIARTMIILLTLVFPHFDAASAAPAPSSTVITEAPTPEATEAEEIVLVSFDYEAQGDQELSLKKGDLVTYDTDRMPGSHTCACLRVVALPNGTRPLHAGFLARWMTPGGAGRSRGRSACFPGPSSGLWRRLEALAALAVWCRHRLPRTTAAVYFCE